MWGYDARLGQPGCPRWNVTDSWSPKELPASSCSSSSKPTSPGVGAQRPDSWMTDLLCAGRVAHDSNAAIQRGSRKGNGPSTSGHSNGAIIHSRPLLECGSRMREKRECPSASSPFSRSIHHSRASSIWNQPPRLSMPRCKIRFHMQYNTTLQAE
ncbi:hypothetical protein BC567DRAFT_229960 [Phyllosticta citribraziliensis]